MTIGVLVFFLYAVPSLNARAAVMSGFMAVVFFLTATTLLGSPRPAHVFGRRLTAGIFAVCAATLVARAAYCTFGPTLNDVFASTQINEVFFIASSAQMALLPVSFMLLADEHSIADLRDANERVTRAHAEVAIHRETEAVLRERERRMRRLADTAPVMIWASGPDKGCMYFNRPWLEFTGRSLVAELGNGWTSGVHAADITRCLDIYNQAFDRRQSFHREYRLRRQDGIYRWILDQGVSVTDLDGSFAGYVGAAIDITDRRGDAAARSSLSARLMAVQDTERAWIANALHEDLAQRAVAVGMRLQSLVQTLPAGTRQHSDLQKTFDQAGDLAHGILQLSYHLHSPELAGLGLTAAAERLCAQVAKRHQMSITFMQDSVPALAKNAALCLFRVLQEALNNAIRHAHAPHIDVVLRGSLTDVQLLVIDKGVGFDLEPVTNGPGLGLVTMKERLNLIGGELYIDSTVGAGTTIRARVPLVASCGDEMGV